MPSNLPSRLAAAVLVAAALALAACRNTPAGPTPSAPYSQVDLRQGTGVTALNGDQVSVYYIGWFYDPTKPDGKGLPFDSNRSPGRDVFIFTLGSSNAIEGFNRGVLGMNKGGLRRLVIPPSLAFGSQRSVEIPPFSTLVFEVELIDVQ